MRIKDMMKQDESNNDTSTNSPHYFLGNISGHQMRIWILILGCKGLRKMPMDRDYWVLDQSHFWIIWTFCLVHLKSEVLLLQTSLCLFHLVQFFKCWQFFLELNFKGLYQCSGKEKESRGFVFMFSTKHETRHFLTCRSAVMAKKCPKKHDALEKLLFCQSQPIAFLTFSVTLPSLLLKSTFSHQKYVGSRLWW